MSIYEPARGGTRGGKDQFIWEDVKSDKHRENYLGKDREREKYDQLVVVVVVVV